jgi:small-conductance mechanosensitive channel
MIARVMITYMWPFKIGDRIVIAGVKGDVIKKHYL